MSPLVGPLVGITGDYQGGSAPFYSLAEEYVAVISSCEGIPLILPAIEDNDPAAVIDRLDALLISGGDFDIDPDLYGETPHPELGKLKPRRTEYELLLLREALEKNMPILAICGGLQLLNVALGGSLYQHLPAQHDTQINHEQKGKEKATAHTISIEQKSTLHDILHTTDIMVNSTHHQAIKKLGNGLTPIAWAPDGLVEAVEDQAHRFVLGVQWHPEALIKNQPVWKRLFERLIQEAGLK